MRANCYAPTLQYKAKQSRSQWPIIHKELRHPYFKNNYSIQFVVWSLWHCNYCDLPQFLDIFYWRKISAVALWNTVFNLSIGHLNSLPYLSWIYFHWMCLIYCWVICSIWSGSAMFERAYLSQCLELLWYTCIFYFFHMTDFDLLCKLSPMKTICMKGQSLFSKNSKKTEDNLHERSKPVFFF